MAYNFLRKAKSIRNSFLCAHDNLDGYSSCFHINGDVNGWDVYQNIYLYGSWSSVLFGTAYDRECFIGRSNTFVPIEAEDYYFVRIMMKITNNNLDKVVQGLTKGKIAWTRVDDNIWSSDKEFEFDLVADDQWHLYNINMGPATWWQGSINNLRVYPFIDGWSGDQFAIKFIKISSLNKYACDNTQCSFYLQYTHNCLGAGKRGVCEAGVSKTTYTTISGINDDLIVNIDNYGDVHFNLGNNENLSGFEMSRIVAEKISSLNIGGYAYAECYYTEFNKLQITSGTVGASSSVTVSGTAAESLGFYDGGADVSIKTAGSVAADGFDYASSRLLTATEINKLIDGHTDVMGYLHNPIQYNIEGGRRDFNEIGTGILLSSLTNDEYYDTLNNRSRTLIDYSHPINNNGRIKKIYVFGVKTNNSKVKILRPSKDGSLTVIYSLDFPTENSSYIYTATPTNYRIDCDILVNRGDLIGVYDMDLYVGLSIHNLPDAVFCQVNQDVSGTFTPDSLYSFGIGGFAIYARGDRWQTNVILDIDLGDRVNIEEINLYGKEKSNYFEYNISTCLDADWEVDLFGREHVHSGYYASTMMGWSESHQNKAYGLDALGDGVRTVDNEPEGNGYHSDNGIATTGPHSYFYVNGDAEWLYSHNCDGKHEYCGNTVATDTYGFVTDPVALTLKFPYEFEQVIHKTIIYFKERNNFRNMALSYYLGSLVDTGNADDIHYNYIPEYNSIRLDGILYLPTEDNIINKYIFENPIDDRPQYLYGDHHPLNWEVLLAASQTDWNIIEHNFDPITCKGFRIYTNKHYSTKIIEIEVYSRVKLEPSLLDNVLLYFSDYGDVWNLASFEKTGDSVINAFIGSSPRYLQLELESSSEFELNEIELLVGDEVSTGDCEDVVLLAEARNGVISSSTELEIINNYDKAFDLSVDLPKETDETDNIIFWSKLGSQQEIDEPEIGPTCKLYKQNDYPIRNDNAQCAINVPAYALKNLVDGKKAYYSYNNSLSWHEYGTLSSGVSIDFSNEYSKNLRYSKIVFNSAFTGRYWKLEALNDTNAINTIVVYNDGLRLDIDKIYIKELSSGSSSMGNSIDHNGIEINPSIYNDEFTGLDYSLPDSSKWGEISIPSDCDIYLLNNTLTMVTYNKYSNKYAYIKSKYKISGDFDIQIHILRAHYSGVHPYPGGMELRFINQNHFDEVYFKIGFEFDSKSFVYTIKGWINGTAFTNHDFGASVNCKNGVIVRIVRVEDTLKFYYDAGDGWHYINSRSGFTRDSGHVVIGQYDDWDGYGGYMTYYADNFKINYGLFSFPVIGFKLKDSDAAIDTIELIHTSGYLNDIYIRTSMTNLNDYVLVDDNVTGTLDITTNNQNYNTYLAIDLEKRHDIGLIRNYGDSLNKLWMSTSEGVGYSNTDSSDILDVVVDNSTKNDVRWLLCELLCGDGTTRCIRKLGVYPDISSVFCRNGGHNCEWESLGTILSDYEAPVNVAYGATTTGTNYYFLDFYPSNAVNGINTDYYPQNCWGFQKVNGVDPYLELDLGNFYTINKVILYHGVNPEDDRFMNIDYSFSVSTSTSGSFTTIFSTTGNSDFTTINQFDPVVARRIRLIITKYDGERERIQDPSTGDYLIFDGSYLREIEVYTYTDTGYIDSETWPIVCMNLKDQFGITDHLLVNKDPNDSSTNWDNSEEFFLYSDDVFDDPKKVSFTSEGEYKIQYQKIDSSGDMRGSFEYVFDTVIYFDEGRYWVEWDTYENNPSNEISLRLSGPSIIDAYGTLNGGGWIHQISSIDVSISGFYDVKGVQHIDSSSQWGARNPIIYRPIGLRKWVSVKRDTAENYAYDNDSNKYGKDYLSLLKVYGDTKYDPTAYSWWWSSSLSTLSNDYLKVKSGERSLRIDYPTSSGVDTISFLEGDNFGQDMYFESKDLLSFWLYIEDISKLDLTIGDVEFGILNDAQQIYYRWNIASCNLSSGWNNVMLKFELADYVFPEGSLILNFENRLDDRLDFRNNGKVIKSFQFRYKGVGQAFSLYLNDVKIKRNKFEDDVKFGKGLCLSGYDYLEIPISTINLERGSIEFWMKTYTDNYGRDIFDNLNSRVLFTILNNNNNIISLGIKSGNWFNPVTGHIRHAVNMFNIDTNDLPDSAFFNIGDVLHIAFVWSNDGYFMDNGDTVRLYINGELICISKTKWELGDSKTAILRLGGPNTQAAYNNDIWGAAIFDNVKVYNYCKTNFNINFEGVEKDVVYNPNRFLEISKDNVHFYNVDSAELPLVFESVAPNDKRLIYIRSNKTQNFGGATKYTGTLIIDWLTTV